MGLSQVITVWQSHFWRKRMNGILCADMDNTIIYSYKRNIGEKKLNVELYNGREISFISEKTHDLLKKVSEKMTIIPTSTRTEEQYKRIDLDIGIVPYALVCNGGVLLVNGKRDREWYLESLRMIRNSIPEITTEVRAGMYIITFQTPLAFVRRLSISTASSIGIGTIKSNVSTIYSTLFATAVAKNLSLASF